MKWKRSGEITFTAKVLIMTVTAAASSIFSLFVYVHSNFVTEREQDNVVQRLDRIEKQLNQMNRYLRKDADH